MPHLRDYISPSQIKAAQACMRLWHGEYCCGWDQPEQPWHVQGKQIHALLEAYLSRGEIPDKGLTNGRIALAMMANVPHHATPHMVVEAEVFIPADVFDTPKPVRGFLDYSVLWQHFVDDVTGEEGYELLVGDHKTLSDFANMQSSEQLQHDPQAIIYSWAAYQKCLEVIGRAPDRIRFQHNYGNKKTAQADLSECLFTVPQLRERMGELAVFMREMLSYQDTRYADVPATGYPNSCGNYRGCPFQTSCAQTGLTGVFGDAPNAEAAARLLASKLSPLKKESDMPRYPGESRFAKTAEALMAAASPATTSPAAPAAPQLPDDMFNPPDGDANGDSKVVATSTDLTETANIEDDLENASDELVTNTAADGGYTAPSEVAPAETTRKRGRPPVLDATRAQIAEVFGKVSSDPAASKRLAAVQHPLASKLAETGTIPTGAKAADLQALLQILRAVVDDVAPTVPTTNTVVTSPSGPVDGDPDVQKAQEGLDAANAVLAAARKDLAAATARLEKAIAERQFVVADGINNSDVVPAQDRVNGAEVQVSEATLALAAAKAAALERKAHEERVLKDAEEKKRVAEANARRAQAQAGNAQEAEQPARAASKELKGLPFPLLIYGGFPNIPSTHLNDIITPYRVRVEQQAMVHHYLAIKGDGAARVAEALAADLQTGVFKLPDVVIASGYQDGLERVCAQAIEPYCRSIIRPAR